MAKQDDDGTNRDHNTDHIRIVASRLRGRFVHGALKNTELAVSTAAAHLATQNADTGSWDDVVWTLSSNYQENQSSFFKTYRHLDRVADLTRAYAVTNSPAILSAINLGLTAWCQRNPRCKNWWHNVIRSPRVIGEILLLLTTTEGFSLELCPSVSMASARCREDCTWIRKEYGYAWAGANLMDVANNLLFLACAERDPKLLTEVADRVLATIRSESEVGQQGIQVDGSFHQHGAQQQTLSYGLVQSNLQSSFGELFINTPWAFEESHLEAMAMQVLVGQRWSVYGRQIDMHALGRSAFRGSGRVHCFSAAKSLGSQLRIMATVDVKRRSDYLAFLSECQGEKSELEGTRYFWRSDTLCVKSSGGGGGGGGEDARGGEGGERGDSSSSWYFSCRFHSKRCLPTECDTNRENILGYYMSDGIHFFMREGDEYHQVQPCWDYRNLPGLTCIDLGDQGNRGGDVCPLPWGNHVKNQRSMEEFVGGASDGIVGATTMTYVREGVRAQKSVFVDPTSGIICLGVGIEINPSTRKDVKPGSWRTAKVKTTLCQRRLVRRKVKGGSEVGVGDQEEKKEDSKSKGSSSSSKSSSSTLEASPPTVTILKTFTSGKSGLKDLQLVGGDHVKEWHCRAAHHDGVAYLLLDTPESGSSEGSGGGLNGNGLTVRLAKQSGAWNRVHDSAPGTEVSCDMWTCWIDHGAASSASTSASAAATPTSLSYAYRIVPSPDSLTTCTSSSKRMMEWLERESKDIDRCLVLANTVEVQAVRLPHATLAVFHCSGVLAGGHAHLCVNAPCALTLREEQSDVLVLSVSDPSQRTAARLQVIISGEFEVVEDGLQNSLVRVEVSRESEESEENCTTTVDVALPEGARAGMSVILHLARCVKVSDQCLMHAAAAVPELSDGATATRLSGGISNHLFLVNKKDSHHQVLVRLYGSGEPLAHRTSEDQLVVLLSSHGFGPHVLSVFDGGRVEEFFSAPYRTLLPSDTMLIEPIDFAGMVASRLGEMHSLKLSTKGRATHEEQLSRWFHAILPSSSTHHGVRSICLVELETAINNIVSKRPLAATPCEKMIEQILLRRTLCHMDLFASNVLYDESKNEVQFIDYEYCATAPVGLDIANHFSGCTELIQGKKVTFNSELYPSTEKQHHFLQKYLKALAKHGDQDAKSIMEKREETNKEWDEEWASFSQRLLLAMAAEFELRWVVWGLLQKQESSVEFDFYDYALQRWDCYHQYRDRADGGEKGGEKGGEGGGATTATTATTTKTENG